MCVLENYKKFRLNTIDCSVLTSHLCIAKKSRQSSVLNVALSSEAFQPLRHHRHRLRQKHGLWGFKEQFIITNWTCTRGAPASQCTVWPQEWADAGGTNQAGWPCRFPPGPTDDTCPSPGGRPRESPPVGVRSKHGEGLMGNTVQGFAYDSLPAHLHPSESLHVQWVVFQKLSEGRAASGIVTS